MSFFSTDAVGSLLGSALDGLSFRQEVLADNIANVDTPGFRATTVDFEDSLRAAVDDSEGDFDPRDVLVTATPSDSPVGVNGNNVDLRKEVMGVMQTTFAYQILTRAAGDRLGNVRIAAGNF